MLVGAVEPETILARLSHKSKDEEEEVLRRFAALNAVADSASDLDSCSLWLGRRLLVRREFVDAVGGDGLPGCCAE